MGHGAAALAGEFPVSDRDAAVTGDVLRVLVVGDSDPIDETAATLSTSFDAVSLLRERSATDAQQRLAVTAVDCVVCPFDRSDRPSTVEQIRESAPEIPIIAVTDDAGADDAIAAGAIDVLDPESSRSLVVTRVRNAAERYRLATEGPDRRYRSILDESAAVVGVIDEDGSIGYVNAAVDDQMGYTPEELERTTLFRLVHPDDRASCRETVAEVATDSLGSTARTTLRIGHADGTWHVSELHVVNRQSDPTVAGLVVTVTDATVDETLDDAFQRAIDRLDGVFFAVGPQWELRVFNEAARTLFASTGAAESSQRSEPRPGTIVWDVLPDAVRGTFADRLREAAATGSPVSFETTPPSAAEQLVGTAYPSETGVSVYASVGPDTAQPSFDRDRLDRFEGIVETLPDGVAVLDDDTIAYANPELFDLTDADTLVGRDLEWLVDDELAAAIRERAQSPLVRWTEPLTGTLTADGVHRPIDVFVLSSGSGADEQPCCLFRDRQGSPAIAIETVEMAVAALSEAEDRSVVRETIVDAVRSYTAADVAVWYIVDDSVIRPTAVTTATPAAGADLPAIDRHTESIVRTLETDGATVSDRDELEPFLSRSGIRGDRVLTVPIGDDALVLATSTDPSGFDGIDHTPIDTLATTASLALDRLDAERHRRELERDTAAFESIVDQADQVRALEQSLFDAQTREEVERQLAEGLVSLDPVGTTGSIELVWIGAVAIGGEEVTPNTWAGRDGSFLETLSVAADAETGEPAGRTAATLEPTFIDDLEDADRDQWQRLAVDRGFRTALSVPVVYDEFCYGTVTVYADQPAAFDERTRSICEHLATVAGYAITAIERKRALVSDSVTELELVVRTDSDPLATIARRLETQLDIRTVVPRSSGGTTVICSIGDTDETAIQEVVSDIEAVDSSRFLGRRASESVVELVCAGDTLAGTLVAHGAVLRSITPTGDRSRLVLELPSTVDVRSFVSMLDRKLPGTELTARREHERATRPDRSFEAEFRDRLSDRQLRTLETAYHSGFFEWPRESTGEDVADALGVSQPTFSRHFRLAQQKVFSLLFEELSAPPSEEE